MGRRRLKFTIRARPEFGFTGQETIYINDNKYENALFIQIIERLNEMKYAKIRMDGVQAADKVSDVKEGSTIKIFQDNTLIFKGTIEKPTEIHEEVNFTARGQEHLLAKIDINDRQLFTDEATDSIVGKLLSTNLDDSNPYIIQEGTVSNFGTVSFRAESTNRLQNIDNIAEKIGWDWYVDTTGHPYDTDQFNFVARRGNDSSVKTFKTAGASGQNAAFATVETDRENVINHIKILGYGDGINQLRTSMFAASDVYSNLDGTITATDTTITLDDASSFPSKGIIIISEEAIPYTAISSNDLTGCTRDSDALNVNEQSYAKTHSDDVLVFDFYDGSSSTNNTLDGAIDDDDTTISLTDASSFDSSGDIIIGKEVVTYTGKSTNDLTGCTRGARGTTATDHTNGLNVFQYDYTKHYTHIDNSSISGGSPKSGSAIDTDGLSSSQEIDRSLSDTDIAELWASDIISRRKDAIKRRTLTIFDMSETTVTVGDEVTVNDTATGLDTDYQVVGIEKIYDFNSSDYIKFELSNKRYSFEENIATVVRRNKISESFALGSTALIGAGPSIQNMESVSNGTDNPNPGTNTLFFAIPDDVINLNSIKLHYRLMNPIVNTKATSSGGGATSGDGGSETVSSVENASTFSSNTSSLFNWSISTTGAWQNHASATATTPNPSHPAELGHLAILHLNPSVNCQLAVRIMIDQDHDSSWSVQAWEGEFTNFDTDQSLVYKIPLDALEDYVGDPIRFEIITDTSVTLNGAHMTVRMATKHTHDVTTSNHYHSIPNHAHNHNFDIQTRTYGTSDVQIWTTDDASGANPTWTDRTATIEAIEGTLTNTNGGVETNIELKDFFSADSGLKGVRMRVDGDARSYLQLSGKVFIESKKV